MLSLRYRIFLFLGTQVNVALVAWYRQLNRFSNPKGMQVNISSQVYRKYHSNNILMQRRATNIIDSWGIAQTRSSNSCQWNWTGAWAVLTVNLLHVCLSSVCANEQGRNWELYLCYQSCMSPIMMCCSVRSPNIFFENVLKQLKIFTPAWKTSTNIAL